MKKHYAFEDPMNLKKINEQRIKYTDGTSRSLVYVNITHVLSKQK